MNSNWIPTRRAALERLSDFLPWAGLHYRDQRNYDFGPDSRENVSGLSPYFSHRILLEEEAVSVVLREHAFDAAEKFLQEIFWRTYWKGWLAQRPSVWHRYQEEVEQLQREPDTRYQDAVSGRTGIECFDVWVRELIETGYLHNHARMWFASIWIFTLELPWQLGAAFFYRHLLDADPASNTLGWRWVAGLQTRGKHYVARAENIRRFTGGRFDPAGQLNEHAQPLSEAKTDPLLALPEPDFPSDGMRSVWLLFADDLRGTLPESSRVSAQGAACVEAPSAVSRCDRARAFSHGAALDALARLRDEGVDGVEASPVSVAAAVEWVVGHRAEQVIMLEAYVGPAAEQQERVAAELKQRGVRVCRVQREWERRLYPHATRGFFAFKAQLPQVAAAREV